MTDVEAPVTGVWEITMGCNMRCKHCGSSCTNPLPDELTTDEALALCDDIAALGLQWITLSGGEPLTRSDWPLLVRRLREGGVIPNIITNGWMCDAETVATARDAGVGTFALSLDGMKATHDYIRRKGSYDRCLSALSTMAEAGVSAGVITTVHRRNIAELPEMHRMLKEIGVESWQLQIGLPMGNFRRPERADLVAEPEDVDRVIDFIYSHGENDGRMSIYPADCLGYYSRKELVARQRAFGTTEPVVWQGCNAGRRSLGILHNGDVLGCTSIRDRSFIEGNLRQRPLRDIWYDPEAFPWARRLTKQDLGGTCRSCAFGDTCLGGCPNTRLTMNGTIHSENTYCSYNVALTKAREEVGRMGATADTAMARRLIDRGEMQLAALVLEKVTERDPGDREALGLLGYVNYALNNLDDSRRINERVLALDPTDVYATKGLGVVLHRLGRTDEGIATLRRAVDLSGGQDLDSMH
ncbi:MAG: radical SAM protein, partial [Pseudomonadota bacterium]